MQNLRNPEIQNLHHVIPAPLSAQENVLGLEVAMHNPAFVSSLKGTAHLLQEHGHFPNREAAASCDPLGKVLALQEFEHHVRDTVLRVVEIEDLHDVLVPERTRYLCLPLEALKNLAVPHHLRIEEFHGKSPWHAEMRRLVNDPHAPLGNDALQTIGASEYRADATFEIGTVFHGTMVSARTQPSNAATRGGRKNRGS